MRGLLYKEFCMMKVQYRSWALAFLIFCGYAVVLKDLSMLFMFTAVMGIMASLASFSYDNAYHCDEFVLAAPVSRRQIVLSKYLFLLLLDLMLAAVSILLVLALREVVSADAGELFGSVAGVLAAVIFLQLLFMPLIYVFGPEKARLFYIIIGLLPCVLLILYRDRIPSISEAQFFAFAKLIPVFLLILGGVSVMISVSAYKRKEF